MSDPNNQPPVDPAAQSTPPPPQQPYQQSPQAPQPPYQQPQYTPPAASAPLTAAEDKQWAMWSHIGGIIGFLPSLIIFLVFKDRGERTRTESKEALNWQITFTIIYIALLIVVSIINTILLVTPLFGLAVLIGFLPLVWWIVDVVLSILGGVRVNAGGYYRYPLNFRFIK